MIELGDAFISMPSSAGTKHLCVVLAFRTKPRCGRTVILVNVTTARGFIDRSCILCPDDADAHPFVRHRSFVSYEQMCERSESLLLSEDPAAPVSSALLLRMLRGAFASPLTPNGFVPFLKDAMQSLVK